MVYLIMCRTDKPTPSGCQRLGRASKPGLRSPEGPRSYSVKIAQRNLARALTILHGARLPYLGIYVNSAIWLPGGDAVIHLDSAATTLQKPPSVPKAVAQALATMTSPGRGNYGPAARASQTLLACREAAAERFRVAAGAGRSDVQRHPRAEYRRAFSDQAGADRGPLWLRAQRRDPPLGHDPRRAGQTGQGPALPPGPLSGGVRAADGGGGRGRLHPRLQRLRLRPADGAGRRPVSAEWGAVFGGCVPICRGLAGPDGRVGRGVYRHAGAQGAVRPPGHGSAPVPGERDASAGWGHGQSLPPGGEDARPLGSRDPQRPRRSGSAGGSAVSAQAGAGVCRQEAALIRQAAEGLSRLPEVQVYAAQGAGVQTGVLSFRLPQKDPGWVAEALSRRGIAVRAGLHCAPWPTPPGARSKPGRSASASLPSTPAGRSRPFWQPCRPWCKTPQGCA